MTVYAILSKIEEPIPSGKIDFTYQGSGNGTAFTVPSGITKVKVTVDLWMKADDFNYNQRTVYKVFSVTAGETIYAKDSRWCNGARGVTPVVVIPRELEYGPEINKLKVDK